MNEEMSIANLAEEFRKSKLTDKEKITEKVEYLYSIMMDKGYMKTSEVREYLGTKHCSVISDMFEGRDKPIYASIVTHYSMGRTQDNFPVCHNIFHVKVFRPFEIINNIWRKERRKSQSTVKNGYINTHAINGLDSARRIG